MKTQNLNLSDNTAQQSGFLNTFKDVIEIEEKAVATLKTLDPNAIEQACELIKQCKGRIICSGMGKSGHIAKKIAATFASTGTPSQFVHPAEASHGDLGMIQKQDMIIAISNSGETKELSDLLHYAGRHNIKIIAITKQTDSTLAKHSEIVLQLPNGPEACSIKMAPTTSTTCSLVLGDALAVSVMKSRGFAKEDFLNFHPGGKLGAQLLTVEKLMHQGDLLPILDADASMEDCILEMTSKGFGIAAIVKDNVLESVITDGDLRRNIKGLMDKSVSSIANYKPKTISPNSLATEALSEMNTLKVTALCVVDDMGHLVGLIHLHDCLRHDVA